MNCGAELDRKGNVIGRRSLEEIQAAGPLPATAGQKVLMAFVLPGMFAAALATAFAVGPAMLMGRKGFAIPELRLALVLGPLGLLLSFALLASVLRRGRSAAGVLVQIVVICAFVALLGYLLAGGVAHSITAARRATVLHLLQDVKASSAPQSQDEFVAWAKNALPGERFPGGPVNLLGETFLYEVVRDGEAVSGFRISDPGGRGGALEGRFAR